MLSAVSDSQPVKILPDNNNFKHISKYVFALSVNIRKFPIYLRKI